MDRLVVWLVVCDVVGVVVQLAEGVVVGEVDPVDVGVFVGVLDSVVEAVVVLLVARLDVGVVVIVVVLEVDLVVVAVVVLDVERLVVCDEVLDDVTVAVSVLLGVVDCDVVKLLVRLEVGEVVSLVVPVVERELVIDNVSLVVSVDVPVDVPVVVREVVSLAVPASKVVLVSIVITVRTCVFNNKLQNMSPRLQISVLYSAVAHDNLFCAVSSGAITVAKGAILQWAADEAIPLCPAATGTSEIQTCRCKTGCCANGCGTRARRHGSRAFRRSYGACHCCRHRARVCTSDGLGCRCGLGTSLRWCTCREQVT